MTSLFCSFVVFSQNYTERRDCILDYKGKNTDVITNYYMCDGAFSSSGEIPIPSGTSRNTFFNQLKQVILDGGSSGTFIVVDDATKFDDLADAVSMSSDIDSYPYSSNTMPDNTIISVAIVNRSSRCFEKKKYRILKSSKFTSFGYTELSKCALSGIANFTLSDFGDYNIGNAYTYFEGSNEIMTANTTLDTSIANEKTISARITSQNLSGTSCTQTYSTTLVLKAAPISASSVSYKLCGISTSGNEINSNASETYFADFDLSTIDNEVSSKSTSSVSEAPDSTSKIRYYTSQADAQSNSDALTELQIRAYRISGQRSNLEKIIYAKVTSGSCSQIVEVYLKVLSPRVLTQQALVSEGCINTENNEAVFDISDNSSKITAIMTPTRLYSNLFIKESGKLGNVESATSLSTTETTLDVTIDFADNTRSNPFSCTFEGEINLRKLFSPNAQRNEYIKYSLCEDVTGTEKAKFDLTTQDVIVKSDVNNLSGTIYTSANVQVAYFSSVNLGTAIDKGTVSLGRKISDSDKVAYQNAIAEREIIRSVAYISHTILSGGTKLCGSSLDVELITTPRNALNTSLLDIISCDGGDRFNLKAKAQIIAEENNVEVSDVSIYETNIEATQDIGADISSRDNYQNTVTKPLFVSIKKCKVNNVASFNIEYFRVDKLSLNTVTDCPNSNVEYPMTADFKGNLLASNITLIRNNSSDDIEMYFYENREDAVNNSVSNSFANNRDYTTATHTFTDITREKPNKDIYLVLKHDKCRSLQKITINYNILNINDPTVLNYQECSTSGTANFDLNAIRREFETQANTQFGVVYNAQVYNNTSPPVLSTGLYTGTGGSQDAFVKLTTSSSNPPTSCQSMAIPIKFTVINSGNTSPIIDDVISGCANGSISGQGNFNFAERVNAIQSASSAGLSSPYSNVRISLGSGANLASQTSYTASDGDTFDVRVDFNDGTSNCEKVYTIDASVLIPRNYTTKSLILTSCDGDTFDLSSLENEIRQDLLALGTVPNEAEYKLYLYRNKPDADSRINGSIFKPSIPAASHVMTNLNNYPGANNEELHAIIALERKGFACATQSKVELKKVTRSISDINFTTCRSIEDEDVGSFQLRTVFDNISSGTFGSLIGYQYENIALYRVEGGDELPSSQFTDLSTLPAGNIIVTANRIISGGNTNHVCKAKGNVKLHLLKSPKFLKNKSDIIISGCESSGSTVYNLNEYTPSVRRLVYNSTNLSGLSNAAGSSGGTLEIAYNSSPIQAEIVSRNVYLNPKGSSQIPEANYGSYTSSTSPGAGVAYISYPPGTDKSFISNISLRTIYCTAILPINFEARQTPNFRTSSRALNYSFCQDKNTSDFATFDINPIEKDIQGLIFPTSSPDIVGKDFYYFNSRLDAESKVNSTGKIINLGSAPQPISQSNLKTYTNTVANSQEFGYVYAYRYSDGLSCGVTDVFNVDIMNTVGSDIDLEKCVSGYQNGTASFDINAQRNAMTSFFSASGTTISNLTVLEARSTTNLASNSSYATASTALDYSFNITKNTTTCKVEGKINIDALASPSIPSSTPLSDFILCESTTGSQIATFNLSSKLSEITNKETVPNSFVIFDPSETDSDARVSNGQITNQLGGIQGSNRDSYTNTSQTQTIGVTLVARHGSTLCGSSTSFDIKAEGIKSLRGLSELLNCNGSQSFNLRTKKSEIINLNSTSIFKLATSDIKIYRTSAEAFGTAMSTTDISNRVAHSIAPASIDILYVKSVKGCYNISSFRTVAFNPKRTLVSSIEGCPPLSSTIGKTNAFVIDITSKEAEIIRGVSEFKISYFNSLSDAQSDTNRITSTTNYPVNNITRKNKTKEIHVKVTYGTGTNSCRVYTSFNAGITFPNINVGSLVECEGAVSNQSTFDIAARKQIIDRQLTANISNFKIYEEGSYSIDLSSQSSYNSANKTLVLTMVNTTTNCRINDTLGLLVSKRPKIVVPTSAYKVCEIIVGGANGIFNLSSKDSEILDQVSPLPTTRNSVSWYSSSGGTNTLIATPGKYESASRVVIARASGADPNTNKICTRDTNLTLTVQATANMLSEAYPICSRTNNANFDLLSRKNDIVRRDARISSASELAFYKTLDESKGINQNPVDISSNASYSSGDARIYIKHASTCRVGTIDLDVKDGRITANKPKRDLYVCDYTSPSTRSVVNLSAKDSEVLGNQTATITYHTSTGDALSAANPITNTSNYTVPSNTFPVDIHVRVENSDGCFDITNFDIEINAPIGSTTPVSAFFECDNNFDLSGLVASSLIENLNASDYNVKFYEISTDAVNDNNTITVSRQDGRLETLRTINANQTVYARVEHKVSQCYETQTVSLNFNAPRAPLTISNYTICSHNVLGVENYNLVQKKSDIISENPSLSSVPRSELKMFRTRDEATDRVMNPMDISVNSNYTAANNTRIYFQNGSRCDVFEFTLEISPEVFAYKSPNIRGCVDKLGSPLPVKLIDARQDIIGNQNLADVKVTFHSNLLDARSGFNLLDDGSGNNGYQTTTYPLDVFVRVVNKNSTCFATNSFTVEAAPFISTLAPNKPIGSCEGFVDFTELVDPVVLGSLDATKYDISYYNSSSDANENINKILDTGANNINKFKVNGSSVPIYVRVEDKDTKCYNIEKAVLSEEDAERPVLLVDKLLESCDYDQDKEEVFDLLQIRSQISDNPSEQKFEFFSTPPNAVSVKKIEDKNLSSYKATKPIQRLYVKAINNNSKCQSIGSFLVKVSPIPLLQAKKSSLLKCDLDDDFKELFDLTESEESFLGRYNRTGKTTYYLDEIDAKGGDVSKSLPNKYTNIIPGVQTIAVRFENAHKCFLIGTLMLNVEKANLVNSAGIQMIQVCDGRVDNKRSDEDGISIFNLVIKEDDFSETLNVNNPGVRYSYTYHNTVEKALRGIDEIQTPEQYINEDSPFRKEIIVRIQNKGQKSCNAISGNLELRVIPIPKLELPKSGLFCIDNDEKPEPIGVSLGPGIDYLWSTGETTPFITPKNEGEYKVTTTSKILGCTYTSNAYDLKYSSLPRKVDVVTSPFSNKGSIKINIENHFGNDKILYALDDNKKYTPSPEMDNIAPGEHILYIKDKDGCGNLVKNVFIPGYANFLTPNGDTINDTWKIYGVRDLPRYRSMVSIYDRYSNKIIDYNPNKYEWDGTFKGGKLPADDYWFIIRFRQGDNEKWETYKGHVALKR